MAKEQEKEQEKQGVSEEEEIKQIEEQIGKKIPADVQEKLKNIKTKLEKFQGKVLEKFEDYVMGISLLPPQQEQPQEQQEPAEAEEEQEEKQPQNPDAINVLLLVDDSDSQKMSKEELKEKLTTIISGIAENVDKNLNPQIVLLTELWQSCYDSKYDILQLIAMSAPVYDTGMLSAVKIAEIHKSMVLKKFEKYIVSYVLSGSLTQGKATPESDIDVFIVIDDTDVKKMTRAELKDKLRAIIIGMGIEAGEMTGIKNKLNIQVYILTDFWDSVKEANPVIFTLLRSGVPFYDRGIFMPWKQLLEMGKIKPSMEAIDMYRGSGEQMLERVHDKLRDIGTEDMFWAILTPSQAALMLYGYPPPTPKESVGMMRDVFVKKEKLLEEKYVKTLEEVIKIRKEIEHGTKKQVSGAEVDKLLKASEEYLKRIETLFDEIEVRKEQESMVGVYETTVTIVRDLLRLEGIDKVKDMDVERLFESELISVGKIPEKYMRILKNIIKAKKDYDAKKLTKHEVDKVRKESREFIKFVVEYMQRSRGRELERTKIRIKHGETFGEVLLLEDTAFIIHDIDEPEKTISKAEIKKDGSLGTVKDCKLEEMEEHLAKIELFPKVFIKQPVFEDLKRLFGKDVEILMNY